MRADIWCLTLPMKPQMTISRTDPFMNPGMTITIIIFISIFVVSVATVYVFRWITNWLGTGDVTKEGIILAESGIVVPGPFFLHKKVIGYEDVKSVELLSAPKSILFLFRISVHWICPHPFSGIVAIELKSPPQYYRYLVIAPKQPLALVEQLELRIKNQMNSTRQP